MDSYFGILKIMGADEFLMGKIGNKTCRSGYIFKYRITKAEDITKRMLGVQHGSSSL